MRWSAKTDVANHVLLEPDAASDGYFLRLVNLDSDTGAITWDSTSALGKYTLPVSAAALHSSGRVVTIHTDSGRVGLVQPAATDSALPSGHLRSGPGTQIGWLQSPIAVAVTNPGAVLILEAGASQLAAFDLNGNPVKYFGPPTRVNTGLHWPRAARSWTWQSTALATSTSCTTHGDGTDASEYHIDVYNPDRHPLATNSPGTNVAHLAVDYWRSIYAANYSALLDTTTNQPHIDPTLNVPEPSLSRFDPTSG